MVDDAARVARGDHTAGRGERGPVARPAKRRRLRLRVQEVERDDEGDR